MKNLASLIPTPAAMAARRASAIAAPPKDALSPEQVQAVLDEPVPATLALALRALDGPLVPVTRGDGAVTWEPTPVPPEAIEEIDYARLRLQALKQSLEPAADATVRRWVTALVASMETKMTEGEKEAEIKLMVGIFDLPACCFTRAALRLVTGEAEWLPKYAKVNRIIRVLADGPKAEIARLTRLIALLERREQRLLSAPTEAARKTSAEVEAWVEECEGDVADAYRVQKARLYLTKLRQEEPALAEQFGARLRAIIATPLPTTGPKADEPPPATPALDAARAAVKAGNIPTDTATLLRLQEEAAKLVVV